MTFIATKLFWVFASPGNLLVLLLLVGGFLALSHHEGRARFGRGLCFLLALVMFFIGILPISDWALAPLENRFPANIPAHVDGIILLGGDEKPVVSEKRGQPSFLLSGARYMEFAALARKYPQATLLYTGGSGLMMPQPTKLTNADVVRASLDEIGMPTSRVVFEDHSRNTHENAVMSAQLVHPNPKQNWLLITSAFHMPRAIGCFREAGWNVYPAPTGYLVKGTYPFSLHFDFAAHLWDLTTPMREYIGLIGYRLLGYTDKIWP